MPKIKDDMACDEYETETGGCIPDLGEEKIMLQRDGRPKEDEAHCHLRLSQIFLFSLMHRTKTPKNFTQKWKRD